MTLIILCDCFRGKYKENVRPVSSMNMVLHHDFKPLVSPHALYIFESVNLGDHLHISCLLYINPIQGAKTAALHFFIKLL